MLSISDSFSFQPSKYIHLFQSNQHFHAIEFVDRPIPEKLYILALIFPAWLLSRQDTYPHFPSLR